MPKIVAKRQQETTGGSLLDSQGFMALMSKMLSGKLPERSSGTFIEIAIDNYANLMSWYDYATANHLIDELITSERAQLRTGDAISRLYMDRIGILLKDYRPKEVEKVIRKLHEVVSNFETKQFRRPMHLVSSLGSVDFPTSARRVEEVLHKGFIARISASTGPNLYFARYEEVESSGMLKSDEARIMHEVQSIIDDNRFKPAFQPIIDSKTGDVMCYECLLRVASVDGAAASSAGALIPVAEKMNFIRVIDRIVLQKVVDELKANKDLRLTFNVSNATTDDAEWLKLCTKLMKNPDIATRAIIEITETAAHRDLRETAYFVASLQGLGCQVALDDFGAGYTSFRQLKTLSVDMVKIDGAYIKDLANNRENRVFIKTILDFTQHYGLKSIAEFVESGDVAKMLIEMGVDYLQGYYFGMPEIGAPWKNRERNLFDKRK